MGSSIVFFATESDSNSLERFAESLGLYIVSPAIGENLSTSEDKPFCYLSLVSGSQFHPYGNPPVKLSDARDPLLGFMRSYFKNPYLVAGHIHWSNDVPMLASQTKAPFRKLVKWIRGEWEKYGDSYLGPEAKILIQNGAEMVSSIPGQAEFKVITHNP